MQCTTKYCQPILSSVKLTWAKTFSEFNKLNSTAASYFINAQTIHRSVEYGLNAQNIEPFQMGLRHIGLHTPIWPDPFQYDFGDGQVLLSNLAKISMNVTKTVFPVNFDPNQIQHIQGIIQGDSILRKPGFGSSSKYVIHRIDKACPHFAPLNTEITFPMFHPIPMTQIHTIGELSVFFVNQTVISIIHYRCGMPGLHNVLEATPLDLLMWVTDCIAITWVEVSFIARNAVLMAGSPLNSWKAGTQTFVTPPPRNKEAVKSWYAS